MANDAVDKVRRGEHKRLLKDGDDRLKGSTYFWLTSLENHSEKQSLDLTVSMNPRVWRCRKTRFQNSIFVSSFIHE